VGVVTQVVLVVVLQTVRHVHHSVGLIPGGLCLLELLVALAVLGVVGAIIISQYIGLQKQAQQVVAEQQIEELNDTFSRWMGAGGYAGPGCVTSDLLKVLISGSQLSLGTGDGLITESPLSATIRCVVPPDLSDAVSSITTGRYFVPWNGNRIMFNTSTSKFQYFAGSFPQATIYLSGNGRATTQQNGDVQIFDASGVEVPIASASMSPNGKLTYKYNMPDGSTTVVDFNP
jgi:type II secretory pathway pseudopilin PulG